MTTPGAAANTPRVHTKTLENLVIHLRDDFNNDKINFVLLYAYNGTGKTRVSMAFKERGKQQPRDQILENPRDTLYFNAFTEDLFTWDNDFETDSRRVLRMNADSQFLIAFKRLSPNDNIREFLRNYVSFNFDIDYDNWEISFFKEISGVIHRDIKISRGEERIFVWCVFMAIMQLVFDDEESYKWVKYIYIDDPVSSLDDNNAIGVATDLARLLRNNVRREDANGDIKKIGIVISSHHTLFFNVMYNELKRYGARHYLLNRKKESEDYTIRATDDTPFYHHIAMLSEIQKAVIDDKIYTYHFNMLRNIMEKTSAFFGQHQFSYCLEGMEDEALYQRALDLLSHGKHSMYEPKEMQEETKALFTSILNEFLNKYSFELPDIFS